MRTVLGWFGRNLLLYLLLVLAIGLFTYAGPRVAGELAGGDLASATMSASDIRAELARLRDEAQADLDAQAADMRTLGSEALNRRLRDLRAQRARVLGELAQGGGWLASIRPSGILERKRRELELARLDTEIAALDAATSRRVLLDAEAAARARLARYARIPTAHAVRVARRICTREAAALAIFERQPALEKGLRNLLDERNRLEEARQTACERAERLETRRSTGQEAARQYRIAREQAEASQDWTMGRIEDVSGEVQDGTTLRDILVKAALALLAIILLPHAIRLLFYFVLAPLAERRATIRLAVPGGAGKPIAPVTGSAATAQVRLGEGEELLVRQGFLQSSSRRGDKATRWLLDWRHPFSSLASGMAFLTRIRGAGQVTTISATADPFAEVAIVELPEGASCVLQPRALAAIAQPVGRPLRITSHWRLFTLNAWLTVQLRYLVFHGPARLVLKGGRGVRVERAEEGRIFAQDQLVGFSADLAYAVTRTETFWPYFLGRESLLKDRVEKGEGLLVIEEAPLASLRGDGVRGGLEGALDAFLKVFGL